MSTPEKQFYLKIKSHLPGDVSRIENYADRGTPDVTGGYYGHDYWVELKISKNKLKQADLRTLLEPSQVVWHQRRGPHGTIIMVIVGHPTFIVIYQWIHGEYVVMEVIERKKNKWDWISFETTVSQIVTHSLLD